MMDTRESITNHRVGTLGFTEIDWRLFEDNLRISRNRSDRTAAMCFVVYTYICRSRVFKCEREWNLWCMFAITQFPDTLIVIGMIASLENRRPALIGVCSTLVVLLVYSWCARLSGRCLKMWQKKRTWRSMTAAADPRSYAFDTLTARVILCLRVCVSHQRLLANRLLCVILYWVPLWLALLLANKPHQQTLTRNEYS